MPNLLKNCTVFYNNDIDYEDLYRGDRGELKIINNIQLFPYNSCFALSNTIY